MDNIDAVILAGGRGTRLEGVVSDRPKPMAAIQGRPFLDLLIEDLMRQGLRRFVLSVGHRREQIIEHYRTRNDAEFAFSEEDEPLGTGGAVRAAVGLVRAGVFLTLNGDSFCRVRIEDFVAFHESTRADASMVVADSRGRTDGGSVDVAEDGRVLRFLEKAAETNRMTFINAGIYLMPKSLPSRWEFRTPFSLEHDVFPRLVAEGRFYGFRVDSEVIDIGTPDRYAEAQSKL